MNNSNIASSKPSTPEALLARFGELVAQQKLEELVALYEFHAVFTPEPGVVCSGHEEIRAALAQMLALAPSMKTVVKETHIAGDIALVVVDWTMLGAAPDGTPIEKKGTSADVLRRQPDGSWRVLIDHP